MKPLLRALLGALLIPCLALSQEAPRVEESISVGYVMVPFTVLNQRGIPITDLRKNEVTLMIDGVKVRSDMFERALNAPVSFTILLDGSGSMGLAGKMDAARAAIGALIAHKRAGDDFSLYVFADAAAREVVPFTENTNLIARALQDVKPFGKTAFFDALSTMPERSKLGKNPTRAIILLSDGIDNNSHLTRTGLAQLLEGVSVPIYPLGLRDARDPAAKQSVDPKQPNEELSDVALLASLASLTGGRLYIGNQPDQLSTAIAGIERDLRAQYLIGFTPTGKGAVKYRRISLRLAGRVRSASVRAGYKGTEPPVASAGKAR